jgi:hypothetical protein
MPAYRFKYFRSSVLLLFFLALLPAFLSLDGPRLDSERHVRYKMRQDFLRLLITLRSIQYFIRSSLT